MRHDQTEADRRLSGDIERFIRDESTGRFEDLLLRLFKRQYNLNEAYRIYCDSLGLSPGNVSNWQAVPAVPAKAFKIANLTCAPVEEARAVFHSSGTTEGAPSRHYLDATAVDLYNISLIAGYYRVVPAQIPIIALMPTLADAPHSSLSFMLQSLNAERFMWGDPKATIHLLDRVQEVGEPICLFGTAFALLELFDATTIPWQLPLGSFVVETGGFKGRIRQVSKDELYGLIEERLGVKPPNAMAEYGMSEMASQYYGSPSSGLSSGHWLRTRIIDPITEDEAAEGLLRHYDLANWNSAAVIQTQDMGVRLANGAFSLTGRAPQAELRGCSLTVEERWKTFA